MLRFVSIRSSPRADDVRAFNPPRFGTALGWMRRNHRKLLVIDSRVAFVGGLCVGQSGRACRRRDTIRGGTPASEITGPAVAHAERAFAESWRFAGGEIDDARRAGRSGDARGRTGEPPTDSDRAVHGRAASRTRSARRGDGATNALDRRRLLHRPRSVRRSAAAAARDGVDVRLLLPQGSDVGWTVPLSRTLYRTLLESGVRIFEWNGIDDARQDRRRRLALGAHRIDEPQHQQLARQLGARRRDRRRADGADHGGAL